MGLEKRTKLGIIMSAFMFGQIASQTGKNYTFFLSYCRQFYRRLNHRGTFSRDLTIPYNWTSRNFSLLFIGVKQFLLTETNCLQYRLLSFGKLRFLSDKCK